MAKILKKFHEINFTFPIRKANFAKLFHEFFKDFYSLRPALTV